MTRALSKTGSQARIGVIRSAIPAFDVLLGNANGTTGRTSCEPSEAQVELLSGLSDWSASRSRSDASAAFKLRLGGWSKGRLQLGVDDANLATEAS